MKKRALFLDRDGVINKDHGYVYRPEDFEFVDGIFELVAAAKHAGYVVVVVTNQSGIGRGYYTEAEFHYVMAWMNSKFEEHDGIIDAVYFSPFHPNHGIGDYRRESNCRKPSPGMFLKARDELNIDMKRSILIGDKSSDMAAGLAAGIGTCLAFGATDQKPFAASITHLSEGLSYISSF
ncbi:D-glycero-D-manno-heptose 1,7-bisphosphate phosphatase [Rhizobium sp. BK226]|uniref:D-glycero-alpha-D-manno-heptose-1,7-bisphosphate 7-phosphatase n=1 Tax=Rhizobium sp. BK226 TaxID=2587075 RepID=UPI00160D6C58|nr:HAD family hydrolase [Rhizobium sp. BK226]MBB4116332.1 D-glycero-D-manno-heptose 1,7-bisphosphate phosphatase [Rhizobium sp. BK226]